jgi:hypothetical protein
MRVSSLSDPRVLELLTKYYVPVWLSRDDYQREKRSRDEQAELSRLDAERAKRKMEGGTVCVFLVAPNGDVLATQRVLLAYQAETLIPFLKKTIADLKVEPRDPEAIRTSIAEATEAKPKTKTKDGRFVHIWTRVDNGNDNRGLSNDRVELTAEELKAFLPPAAAQPGASWTIPQEIAGKLFQYGYPPGPYWDVKECKVKRAMLTATLASASEKEAYLDLSGAMELSFPDGKPTQGRITARFVGMARVDRDKRTLTTLGLVSEQAGLVWFWQGKPQTIKMRIAMELEP